jgi:hypothetical protein
MLAYITSTAACLSLLQKAQTTCLPKHGPRQDILIDQLSTATQCCTANRNQASIAGSCNTYRRPIAWHIKAIASPTQSAQNQRAAKPLLSPEGNMTTGNCRGDNCMHAIHLHICFYIAVCSLRTERQLVKQASKQSIAKQAFSLLETSTVSDQHLQDTHEAIETQTTTAATNTTRCTSM